MTHLFKTLPLIALLALAAPAFAQDEGTQTEATQAEATQTEATQTEATQTDAEEPPADPLALSMGEPDIKVGDVYLEGEFTDWQIRCIKTESGNDPCQLYQLLDDGKGNPVAEINIFPLGGEGQPAAGATVITPLETLLTAQLGIGVDKGAVKKYPFSWCSAIGCFSRIGFSDEDIAAFKRGIKARLVIVPVAAPDQKVNLEISLKGFTAGYEALKKRSADAK